MVHPTPRTLKREFMQRQPMGAARSAVGDRVCRTLLAGRRLRDYDGQHSRSRRRLERHVDCGASWVRPVGRQHAVRRD